MDGAKMNPLLLNKWLKKGWFGKTSACFVMQFTIKSTVYTRI